MTEPRLHDPLRRLTEQRRRPEIGVVLGSGLGGFAARLEEPISWGYEELEGMPHSSVPGHEGRLVLGRLEGVEVACLAGRSHLYEGCSAAEVVYGVRLLAAWGIGVVILTNAAGGVGDDCSPGSLMLLSDHLNLTGQNPLSGPTVTGDRFCDMQGAYDPELRSVAREVGRASGVDLVEGIYAGVAGPSYETPAEIRMLRSMGANAVGMSTVLETIALRQLGVRVGAVSLITNWAAGLAPEKLQHGDVQATAAAFQERFCGFIASWCVRLSGACVPGPTKLS